MITVGDIRKAMDGLSDDAEVDISLAGNWIALNAIAVRKVGGTSLLVEVEKTDCWPTEETEDDE